MSITSRLGEGGLRAVHMHGVEAKTRNLKGLFLATQYTAKISTHMLVTHSQLLSALAVKLLRCFINVMHRQAAYLKHIRWLSLRQLLQQQHVRHCKQGLFPRSVTLWLVTAAFCLFATVSAGINGVKQIRVSNQRDCACCAPISFNRRKHSSCIHY